MMALRSVTFILIISVSALSATFAQTTHFALNDDGEHEIGIQATPGEGCTLPFFGNGGSFFSPRFGDDSGGHTLFAIFSFDMETWSPGDSYVLRFTEQDRMGLPFQDLGKVLIEYIDGDEPYPGRFGQAMNLVGTYTDSDLGPGSIDISSSVNALLSGNHERYFYLRFRFEECGDGQNDEDWVQLSSGGAGNPETSVRIVQGATVRTLYFAQFADGGTPESNLSSQIVLINLDDARTANVTVRVRRSDGELMTVDLNGEMVNGEKELTIPAAGTVILATDGAGELQAGTATVVSDADLSGVVLFASTVGYAGVSSSTPLSSVVIPIRSKLPGTNVGLAAMSLGNAQTLTLRLISDEGGVLATAQIQLLAEGQDARFVDQYPWDTQVDLSDFTGSMVVTGTENFAALAILLRPGQYATLPVAAKSPPQ
jgi:hypothetical protein